MLAVHVTVFVIAWAVPADAAKIAWTGAGAYEACLDAEGEKWLNDKAEAIVSGDEAVKSLNDAAVAAWTVEAMKRCLAKGAPADAGNDAVFSKYMAHWREHLYELAKAIRANGGAD